MRARHGRTSPSCSRSVTARTRRRCLPLRGATRGFPGWLDDACILVSEFYTSRYERRPSQDFPRTRSGAPVRLRPAIEPREVSFAEGREGGILVFDSGSGVAADLRKRLGLREGRGAIFEPRDEWSEEFLSCLGALDEEIPRLQRDPIPTRGVFDDWSDEEVAKAAVATTRMEPMSLVQRQGRRWTRPAHRRTPRGYGGRRRGAVSGRRLHRADHYPMLDSARSITSAVSYIPCAIHGFHHVGAVTARLLALRPTEICVSALTLAELRRRRA